MMIDLSPYLKDKKYVMESSLRTISNYSFNDEGITGFLFSILIGNYYLETYRYRNDMSRTYYYELVCWEESDFGPEIFRNNNIVKEDLVKVIVDSVIHCERLNNLKAFS